MFWIGMIVGIVVTILVTFAYIAWCFKICDVTLDDFQRMREVNGAIIENRECTVEVWHDDDCVHADTFEKH